MKFKGKLYTHQEKAVKKLSDSRYSILAHDMGLGKSITSLAHACNLNKSTLIICPSYLRKKWEQEDVGNFVEIENGDDIKVISYNELVKECMTLKKYNTVIIDEAQYIKNLNSNRSQAIHRYIIRNSPECVMMLSGTPIKNRIPEIFSLLQVCYYGNNYPEFKPFYRMYEKFCETFSHERRFQINGYWISQYDGIRNVPALKKMVKPVYFREKSENVIDLPKQNYNEVTIKSRSDYDNKLLKAFELFEKNPDDSAFMTLKAANALAKTPATVELARNILSNDEQLVIFTDHVASCHEIAAELKATPIDGSMSADIRSVHVDRFQKGLSKLIVATIGALSTGHNLTAARYMIFNDFSFVPADLEQAEKRIHRIGQNKACFYYYMFSSPVDKRIYKVVKSKMLVINEFNGENGNNSEFKSIVI